MSVSLDDKITKSEGQIGADTGSEVLIMRVESGRYFSMDGVGRQIWGAIDGKTSVCRLIDNQVEAYDIDRAVAEPEILAFLSDLIEQKLIERV